MRGGEHGWRVSVDVGGTFTDLCAYRPDSGELLIAKVPSSPDDPSAAMLRGLRTLAARQVVPSQVASLLHGTTVTTNALIERRGPRCALFITRGMRGVADVRDQARHGRLLDVRYHRSPALIDAADIFEVDERVGADGNIIQELDEGQVLSYLEEVRAAGITSLAVCFLFSYLEPSHERRVKELAEQTVPGAYVSMSSSVLPRLREWPRMSSTILNAYLDPLLRSYIRTLDQRLDETGIGTRQRFLMQSSGGLMHFAGALQGDKTIHTLLSGPAGGVNAGRALARALGMSPVITMDVGGTSCDIAFIVDGQPLERTDAMVEGYVVAVPAFDITAIGAGGGTIGYVDSGGTLRMGPHSAGADPGPASYRRGGDLPTATDANVVLGYLSDGMLLAGQVELSRSAAVAAIRDRIAAPLGMSVEDAAEGMVAILNTRMADSIRVLAASRGVPLEDAVLLGGGGAGGLHALAVAEELGVTTVAFPERPGMFSAIGLLCTDVSHDYVQSVLLRWSTMGPDALEAHYKELEQRALTDLEAEGLELDGVKLLREADVRYAGQGHELRLPLGAGPVSRERLDELSRRFHVEHQRLRGHSVVEAELELVSCRLRARVPVPQIDVGTARSVSAEPVGASARSREARFDGAVLVTPVVSHAQLAEAGELPGPVIIELEESTIVVRPSWTVHSSPSGAILCRRNNRGGPTHA